MLTIVGSLLGGWILSLFGFDGLVIAGISQLFGVTIGIQGYYTLFAILGAIKSLFYFKATKEKAKNDLEESWNNLSKSLKKK